MPGEPAADPGSRLAACSVANRARPEDIAHEAGVGQMTLYGHYRTRAILFTAALEQALVDGEKRLTVSTSAGPREV